MSTTLRPTAHLKVALRTMLRRPTVLVASVLTLGPALTAAGVAGALTWAILLRPLPHPEADRLAVVEHTWEGFGVTGISGPLYTFYREHARTIERLGLVTWPEVTLAAAAAPAQRVQAARVTAATLELLGARPVAGRLFRAEEDRAGAVPVVLLTHALWREAFGGDPGVMGTSIDVDGRPVTVVGVLAPNLEFPGRDPRLVLPAALDPSQRSLLNIEWWYALARLTPGTAPAAAERELGALLRRAVAEASDGATTEATLETNGIRPVVTDLMSWQTAGIDDFVLLLLVAAAVLVVLAVAAVTNLVLSRQEARAGDLRLRRILGAGDGQLFVYLASEALVLSAAAGLAGALGARPATHLVLAAGALDLPRVGVTWLPGAAAVAAMVLALMLVPLFGLLSLWWMRLERGHFGGARVTEWTGVRKVLLGVQVAASVVLLVAALSLGSSLRALASEPLGFRTGGIVTFKVALPEATYPDANRARAFHREVLAQVRAVPGVTSAGHATGLPVASARWGGAMVFAEGFEDDRAQPTHWWGHVSDGFLETLGVPLRAGRLLTVSEVEESRPAVVVNEAFASLYWDGPAGAVGRRLRRGTRHLEIVGVVGNTAGDGTGSEPAPLVYAPRGEASWGDLWYGVYAVRTTLPPAGLVPAIREVVAQVDRSIPVYDVATLETLVDAESARERLALRGIGVSGAASAIVVAASLGGLLLITIAQRRREIGIRKAVGATDAALRWALLRGVLGPAGAGLAFGTAAVALGLRVPPSLLHGGVAGHAWLAPTTAGLVLLVVVVSLAASRTVARIEPAEALRAE